MEDLLQITLLYDFYGELLTQKQKEVFEMHYNDDLSLSEIGQELSISRQAVRDQLKRTEKILWEYEKKLCLVKKFAEQNQMVEKIKNLIESLEEREDFSQNTKNVLETIIAISNEILE